MHLDLSDDETAALTKELDDITRNGGGGRGGSANESETFPVIYIQRRRSGMALVYPTEPS